MWSAHVSCSTKGSLRYRARPAIVTVALIVGGCLVMSGTTAEPAAGQSSSDTPTGGWSTQVRPAPRVDPTAAQAGPQYVGASSKAKTADNVADPATSTRSNADAK